MTQHRDPVTKAPVPDAEPLTWGLIGVPPDADVKAVADALYEWLDEQGLGQDGYAPDDVPMVGHASDSYVTDHVLLTSAIAYCLAHDLGRLADDLQLIRLAALSHELANRAVVADHLPDQREFLEDAWDMLDEQGRRLEAAFEEEDSLSTFAGTEPPTDDDRLVVLWKAHLAASNRLHNHVWSDPTAKEDIRSLQYRQDFDRHPLKDAGKVGLVYGGATKIKGYVFESARLPEVRGASTLFDRINTLDVPALWNRKPRRSDYGEGEEAEEAYNSARERYDAVRSRPDVLSAPECILYASGGNVLVFAPRKAAHKLTDAIEHIYTEQTLIGNSAAVAEDFSLLEIQYGRRPRDYWLEEFRSQVADEPHLSILKSYYRGTMDEHFIVCKGFGELATVLAIEMNRRRAGRGDEAADQDEGVPERLERAIPHYELLPQTIKCHSCDTRPALVTIDQAEVPASQSPKVFCEPCARKRVAGQVAKRDEAATEWFDPEDFDWWPDGVRPSWEGMFEMFLEQHPGLQDRYYADLDADEKNRGPSDVVGAQDLQEIGATSSPEGYVGYIYADGNDVGALVARIRTPGAYRQFGQRLYLASQSAVFTAFGRYLTAQRQRTSPDPDRPRRDDIWIHPFEIITIGGDDLIVIVPGDCTLDIATAIELELERRLSGPHPADAWTPEEMQERERYQPNGIIDTDGLWTEDKWPAISLSAGVVIARDHTPIPYISALSEQLQKSAKTDRKTGTHRNYPGGTVDFAALKATGMVSLPWKDYRRRAFEELADRDLTARPFTWHELRGLVATARALKTAGFPRSQMYRLQDDLETSRLASSINYLYFLSHLDPQSEAGQRLMETFHQAWHRQTDIPPWRLIETEEDGNEDGERQWETVWRDLVEIYDFVPVTDELSQE